MEVELLVVPDCPHEALARDAVAAAARRAGLMDVRLTVTVLDTDEQAQRRGFIGSPTFLVDGVDPFAVPDAPAGLTCRLYPTSRGPAGVPEVAALRDALVRACACRSNAVGDR